jgi:hypothetical protein
VNIVKSVQSAAKTMGGTKAKPAGQHAVAAGGE